MEEELLGYRDALVPEQHLQREAEGSEFVILVERRLRAKLTLAYSYFKGRNEDVGGQVFLRHYEKHFH